LNKAIVSSQILCCDVLPSVESTKGDGLHRISMTSPHHYYNVGGLLLQMLLGQVRTRLIDMLSRGVRQIVPTLGGCPSKDLVEIGQAWSRVRTVQGTGAKAWVDRIDDNVASNPAAKLAHPEDVQ